MIRLSAFTLVTVLAAATPAGPVDAQVRPASSPSSAGPRRATLVGCGAPGVRGPRVTGTASGLNHGERRSGLTLGSALAPRGAVGSGAAAMFGPGSMKASPPKRAQAPAPTAAPRMALLPALDEAHPGRYRFPVTGQSTELNAPALVSLEVEKAASGQVSWRIPELDRRWQTSPIVVSRGGSRIPGGAFIQAAAMLPSPFKGHALEGASSYLFLRVRPDRRLTVGVASVRLGAPSQRWVWSGGDVHGAEIVRRREPAR